MKAILWSVAGLAVVLVAGWWLGPRLLVGEGDMREPRSEIHAAQLGDDIYVAGGIGFFRVLSSCALFDAAAREWSDCPDLPRGLHHVAMAGGDGRVFASGGYDALPFQIDQQGAIFSLTPGSDQWEVVSCLPHPLGQHTMTYAGGALWLLGGDDGDATLGLLRRYDPSSNTFELRADMQTARHSHAVASDDRRIIASGGRSPQLGMQSVVVELYDIEADSWTRLPDLPVALAGHGSVLVGEQLHVFGGEDLRNGTVMTGHWSLDLSSPDAGWTERQPMSEGRHGFATAAVGNTAWILGGGKNYGWWTPLTVSGTALPLELD